MGIRLDPIRGLIVDDQLSQGSKYTTQAAVRYLDVAWRDRAETPRIGSRESRRANTSFHNVTVHDARPRLAAGQIDLDRSGFTLTQHRTSVTEFRNPDVVADGYYPEMKDLICRVTGASRALVRSHLVRTEKRVDFNDGYARFVHCDYNVARLGEMAHELLARGGVMPQENWTYAWYNTWQPFDHQVQNNPLAFIGWGSLPLPDVIDYFYTGHNQDSLVAAPVYNPDHRWWYFPLMETTEILIVKQLDSRPGRAVYCPHTSFDMPGAAPDSLPRRSFETRLLAVFENAA